ncbi:hypothetical protein AZE42_11181 [Rhizopogon vesiculosus]|uniref:Zn(2)-C6 fungal-type domain-containing protein n=1 Tax=Rhizopogon vesiculosus TaxID=180088 RepID=A0A1J8PVI2_9AGAM|nr:hypothetical protein AZE42_11181 [Rhizopogon vesiculosus]
MSFQSFALSYQFTILSHNRQVRSRVTVVCAECKRLKLKCDRRAPCGSCTKRDTVARCIYSPAAAEKVDLHSLNNRLIAVESQLAQITAPGARFPSSSSSTALPLASTCNANSYNPHDHLSSAMDDITTIWMEEIDIPHPLPAQSTSSVSQDRYIKSEPSPHSLSHLASSSNFATTLPLPLLLPPISHYYTPHPSPTSPPLFTKSLLSNLPFAPRRRMRLYEHAEEALRMMPGPCFSWRVWRERAEGIWRWVESEGASFLTNDYSEDISRPSTSSSATAIATASSRTSTEASKADTARTIFFGPPPAPPPSSSCPSSQKTQPCAQTPGKAVPPSLPFFASVSGVLALALLVEETAASASAALHTASPSYSGGPSEATGPERSININITDRTCVGPGLKKHRKDPSPKDNHTSPALLHALSRQAIGVWEGGLAPCSGSGSASTSNANAPTSEHDLDYISAVVLSVLFVLLCDKGCTTGAGARNAGGNIARGGASCSTKEGWILGEVSRIFPSSFYFVLFPHFILHFAFHVVIGKLVNIARTMGLDVDPDLTPGRYGLYESEARRRAWWDVWWWDVYTSTLSSRTPLIPLHASSTRLPLDVDEEVFTFACTSAPLLSPTGKEGVGRWFGMKVRLAQLVKDINSRTSLLASLDNPSLLLSLENASQCEAEIKQWLSDLPPAFRMESEGMSEETSSAQGHPPTVAPSSSTTSHGSTPPTFLAQRLDILMTTHRLAMGLYLPFLRPHSFSVSDSQSNAKLDASPQTHQARVGALTAAHGLIRAGRLIGFEQRVEMGYSKALFDACIICASSAMRDPGAVWARTAVEDAKTGLALLRDLRELSPALDVSVVEALVRKLESGASSGGGAGSKRKRDGWDEGEGRDAIAVPGGSAEESVPLVPVSANISGQELKLLSPLSLTNATPNTGANALSSTHDASKDKSGSEPKRTYSALVIPSKFPARKDRPREPSKDNQQERSKNCSRGDKEKDRKKVSYPPVGFRVRPGKETSPLARGRTVSTAPDAQGMPPRTTTQGMLATQHSSTIMTPSVSMSSQPMSASQLSVMSQPSVAAPPQPPSLVSTPIDQPSYQSTPTPMSHEGGVDISLPFGAAYEAQPQSGQKFSSYDYASSSASPFSYADTPQYAQYNNCSVPPSTPTSSFPPPQLPYTGTTASQSQPSFPQQTQASQYPSSQAPYNEQQTSRFSFGPQYPETGIIGEYYGTQDKQVPQRQRYQQEYSEEQQEVYSVKPMDQHLAQQQGYASEQQQQQQQQIYVGQGWTQGSDGAYWRSYEHPVQSQPRYQE